MGIVRDLFYARKMSAGLKLPAPTVALLIKRMMLASTMNTGTEKTVSGTLVHITDALAKAALSLLASIEPIQDLHGYANPWPAGGGKNIVNVADRSGITSQTTIANNISLDAGTYTLSAYLSNSGSASTNLLVSKNGSRLANTEYVSSKTPTRVNVSFTVSEGDIISIAVAGSAAGYNASVTKVMIEAGGSMTDYAPYSNICPISGLTGLSVYVSPTSDVADATTYSVDWTAEAGTVYGGTLDVVTGVLTIDRIGITPNVTFLQSINAYGIANFAFTLPQNALNTQSARENAISNVLKTQTSPIAPTTEQGISIANAIIGYVRLDSDVASTKEQANTWISDNGLLLVYYLATPLTYQLTPQEVQMLLGENYLWSSSGDSLSVTYYAEGNANNRQALNILLGDRYSNPGTPDDVSDKEALDIILGR